MGRVSLMKRVTNAWHALRGTAAEDWAAYFGTGSMRGLKTRAGTRVNETGALTISALFAALNFIGVVMAGLPLRLRRRLPDGGSEPATDHPLYDRLHAKSNNSGLTAWQWIYTSLLHKYLWGNWWTWTHRPSFEMEILLPDRTRIDSRWPQLVYTHDGHGIEQPPIDRRDVLLIPHISLGGVQGKGIVHYARESLGLIKAQEDFASIFFGSGIKAGGFVEVEGDMKEETRKGLQKDFNEMYGKLGEAYQAIFIAGGKWKSNEIDPEKAQALESRQFSITEISRWTGLTPHLLHDLTHGTYSNVEELDRALKTFVIAPQATQIEQAINATWLSDQERQKLYVKFDLKGLERGNLQARTAFYIAMLDRGVYNADDVLALEDQNPQPDGLGKVYMLPLNMVNKRMVVGGSVPLTVSSAPMRDVTPARTGIAAPRRYIAQRTSAHRRRITLAYMPLWESYAKKLLEDEAEGIRAGIRDWLANGLTTEFVTWLNSFYDGFRQRIDEQAAPLLSSYAEAILPVAEEETGSDADLKAQMDAFLSGKDGYRETFVLRHLRHSRGSLAAAVQEAEDAETAAEAVLEDWATVRPERLRLHESIRAESALARNVFILAGMTKLVSVSYGKSCPYCLALDGKVIEIQGAFLEPGDFQPEGAERPLTVTSIRRHPPYHDGCLPGHSCVSAEGVSSASKRWYDGDLVIIQTARGHKLSVTPNHPVLTPQGWIAAGALDEGSCVLSRLIRDWVQLGNGDRHNSPSRIEDIAEALLRDREMIAVPVPTAAENFHGDGAGSQVAIVGADRKLWDRIYAPIMKQGGQLSFIRRDSDPARLSGLSGQTLLSERLFSPRRRTVGRSSLSFPLRWRHFSGPHNPGFAIRAGRNSMFSEMASNDAPVDSERQRQAIHRLTGQVAPDQIVSIKRNSFHGYVFNLQTNSGFYVAEGIIAHNCDCGIEVSG